MKKFRVGKILKYLLLGIVVALVGIYFINQKENLDIDEVYTYGLSNSSFQLQIEDFKEYIGEELLKNYATVNPDNRFDVGNVFFNQSMDTHPPLYYMLVNFICSINAGKFSMWYGLIINLIFLIVLYFEMSYLLNLVIKDNILSYVLSILALFTYGFINEIVFIRMYVMLSVISMAFIILIINKIKNVSEISDKVNDVNLKSNNILYPIDVKFQSAFFILCVLGILTQYHYMIIAGFFSVVFAIFLIKYRRFKLLFVTLINGIVAIAISVMIFPSMVNHIFGNNSLHALTADQVTSIPDRFFEIIKTIYQSFFGIGLYIYIIILFIGVILYIIFGRKNKAASQFNKNNLTIDDDMVFSNNFILIIFLIACIFYYIVICLSSSFTFARYLYNIYPLIFIVIISPIYLLYKNVKVPLKYISIVMILALTVTSKLNAVPFSLNAGDSLFHDFLKENKDTKMILLYRSVDKNGQKNTMGGTSQWKLPRPLYSFKDMKNMTFVDVGYEKKLSMSTSPSICGYDDIFLVIYTTEDDEMLIREIMKKNNVTNCQKIYFANYYHVYRLSK